jgi:hypothetical protein
VLILCARHFPDAFDFTNTERLNEILVVAPAPAPAVDSHSFMVTLMAFVKVRLSAIFTFLNGAQINAEAERVTSRVFRWLPHILVIFKATMMELLKALHKAPPDLFCAIICHAMLLIDNPSSLKDMINSINVINMTKSLKESQIAADYEACLMRIKSHRKSIKGINDQPAWLEGLLDSASRRGE